MIRKAVLSDLISVKKITEACTQALLEEGIFQWNKTYPSLEAFEKDIIQGALFVYLSDTKIVGCIMFSEEKDPLYNTVDWLTEEGLNLYVHRLAVHPNFQKKGIARTLMDFAEEFAKRNKMVSVRLDTFSKNERNIRFYEARGYTRLGNVYFSKQSKDPFHCYEKQIKTN
jgi:ribosomal protein S18 acetylase RimI-like enzyme